MRRRVLAELVKRQREAAEQVLAGLEAVPVSDEGHGQAQETADYLRSRLRARQADPGALLDLDRVNLPVNAAPPLAMAPSADQDRGIWLVEAEGWGWLVVAVTAEGLMSTLRDRLELWGVMAKHEVSARPMGRAVRVPDANRKALWWAWAAHQEGRLLIVA